MTWGRLVLQRPWKAPLPTGARDPCIWDRAFMQPAMLRPHLQVSPQGVMCTLWQRPHCTVVRHWALESASSGAWVGHPPLHLRFHICKREQGPFVGLQGVIRHKHLSTQWLWGQYEPLRRVLKTPTSSPWFLSEEDHLVGPLRAQTRPLQPRERRPATLQGRT